MKNGHALGRRDRARPSRECPKYTMKLGLSNSFPCDPIVDTGTSGELTSVKQGVAVVVAILDKHMHFPGISHDSLLDRVAPKWDRGDLRCSVNRTLIGVIECLCDMAELPPTRTAPSRERVSSP
jgi:hypothetical protein